MRARLAAFAMLGLAACTQQSPPATVEPQAQAHGVEAVVAQPVGVGGGEAARLVGRRVVVVVAQLPHGVHAVQQHDAVLRVHHVASVAAQLHRALAGRVAGLAL